jgi:nucleotide-binding universal stress UspA family protein
MAVPIKDILVHVDTTPACRARVWLAVRLARRFDAYLLGVGTQEGGAAEERFAAMLTEHEVQGEWRTITGLIEPSIAGLACSVDLVIIGQPDPDRLLVELATPEDVILACGRPVLVVPYNGAFDHLGERVLVAWNGSREATQAAHDALPLMAMAQAVTVLRVDPETEEDKELSAELVRHLVRHGLPATAALTKRHNLALFDLVMTRAIDADSDLIVMGAYGRSRWREMILGGMTRDMLNKMSLPVLMAH